MMMLSIWSASPASPTLRRIQTLRERLFAPYCEGLMLRRSSKVVGGVPVKTFLLYQMSRLTWVLICARSALPPMMPI
jgi:hypothetical protein